MTPETVDRIRKFVEGARYKARCQALNCREGGYKALAAEHDNEAHLADLILRDLQGEFGDSNGKRSS